MDFAKARRTTREIEPLRGEIRGYLEELLAAYERTPLEEVLDPEQAARVAHAKRMIKVLLEKMESEGGEAKT